MLWNTIYTDAALNQLRMEGFKILYEDVARLSPLGHDHINMLGRYAFTLPARVALQRKVGQGLSATLPHQTISCRSE